MKKTFIDKFVKNYKGKRLFFVDSPWPQLKDSGVWWITNWEKKLNFIDFIYAPQYFDEYGCVEPDEIEFIDGKPEKVNFLRVVPNQLKQTKIRIVKDEEFNKIRLDNIAKGLRDNLWRI